MKTKPNPSLFDRWFIAQHGKRPNIGGSDDDLKSMICAGDSAALELSKRRTYDRRRVSALWAWTARDMSEEKIAAAIKKP